jgi:hypothetical protein
MLGSQIVTLLTTLVPRGVVVQVQGVNPGQVLHVYVVIVKSIVSKLQTLTLFVWRHRASLMTSHAGTGPFKGQVPVQKMGMIEEVTHKGGFGGGGGKTAAGSQH